MAVPVLERTRRRKHRSSRTISLVLIAGIVISAVILVVLLTRTSGGLHEILQHAAAKKVSISDVQDKLEGLDWVRQDVLPVNDYSRPGTALTQINAIVTHYVGNPGTTAAQNRSYYCRLADNHETYASSNFLIGMDGEIVACVPVDEVAYCSNWRNDDTISIECCHPDASGEFTDDTYDAAVRLTAFLCREHHLDASDVIRHYDVTEKECPKYYVDHEDAWETFKADVRDALEALKAPSETAKAPQETAQAPQETAPT